MIIFAAGPHPAPSAGGCGRPQALPISTASRRGAIRTIHGLSAHADGRAPPLQPNLKKTAYVVHGERPGRGFARRCWKKASAGEVPAMDSSLSRHMGFPPRPHRRLPQPGDGD